MNKKSREKLREIKAGYNAVKQKLSATNEEMGELEQKLDYLSFEEQYKVDNTPENLQNSDRYYDREELASALADIASAAVDLTTDCEALINSISELLSDIDDIC